MDTTTAGSPTTPAEDHRHAPSNPKRDPAMPVTQGPTSIPTLLGEMSRLVVLAGLLWGSGDLALLLIDMGHDVRATRILLGRQALHQTGSTGLTPPSGSPRVEGGSFVERGP